MIKNKSKNRHWNDQLKYSYNWRDFDVRILLKLVWENVIIHVGEILVMNRDILQVLSDVVTYNIGVGSVL